MLVVRNDARLTWKHLYCPKLNSPSRLPLELDWHEDDTHRTQAVSHRSGTGLAMKCALRCLLLLSFGAVPALNHPVWLYCTLQTAVIFYMRYPDTLNNSIGCVQKLMYPFHRIVCRQVNMCSICHDWYKLSLCHTCTFGNRSQQEFMRLNLVGPRRLLILNKKSYNIILFTTAKMRFYM